MTDGFGHNFQVHDGDHPQVSAGDEPVAQADSGEEAGPERKPVAVMDILHEFQRRLLRDG